MTDIIDFPQPPSDQDKKIVEACRLIPAWFIPRMTTDSWFFGLLMDTGQTICIRAINRVQQGADGTIWIDVEMSDELPLAWRQNGGMIITPTSRRTASIQASKIMAAFELADT